MVSIRKYTAEDRQAVRDICGRTAYGNMGIQAFLDDGELFIDFWTRYYTDYEPENVWVAERMKRVVGYLMGCVDTYRYYKVMARTIVPPIVGKAFLSLMSGKGRNAKNRRFMKWVIIKSWREIQMVSLEEYPAHFHFNLMPYVFNKVPLIHMALSFLERLDALNIPGLHTQALESKSEGQLQRIMEQCAVNYPGCIRFYSEKPTSLYRDVLGIEHEMVSRIWGSTVTDFRRIFNFLEEYYHL